MPRGGRRRSRRAPGRRRGACSGGGRRRCAGEAVARVDSVVEALDGRVSLRHADEGEAPVREALAEQPQGGIAAGTDPGDQGVAHCAALGGRRPRHLVHRVGGRIGTDRVGHLPGQRFGPGERWDPGVVASPGHCALAAVGGSQIEVGDIERDGRSIHHVHEGRHDGAHLTERVGRGSKSTADQRPVSLGVTPELTCSPVSPTSRARPWSSATVDPSSWRRRRFGRSPAPRRVASSVGSNPSRYNASTRPLVTAGV